MLSPTPDTPGPQRDFDQAVVGGTTYTTGEIVDGNTDALHLNGLTVARETTQSPNMNITISAQERTLSMWIQLNDNQHGVGLYLQRRRRRTESCVPDGIRERARCPASRFGWLKR